MAGAILCVVAIYRDDPHHLTYTGYDQLEVEVLVDGTWYPGRQRSWDRAEEGTWSGMVQWSPSKGMNRLDRFQHPEQIRHAPLEGPPAVSGPA